MTSQPQETSALTVLSSERFAEVVEAGRGLVLVDFFAEWCGPCHVVSPVLEQLARQYAGWVTIAKVDVDVEPALMVRFRVRSLPTVLFFRDGALVDAVVGAHPRAVYAARIAAYLPGADGS